MGGIAEKIMPRPLGNYDPTVSYRILDTVAFNNKLWMAKKSNIIGVEPNKSNSEYWMLCLEGMSIGEISMEFDKRIEDVETGKSDVPTIIDFNIPITGWNEETSTNLIAIEGRYRFTYVTTVKYIDVKHVSAAIQLSGVIEANKCKMLDIIECDRDDTGLMLTISFFSKSIPTSQIPVKICVQY